MSSCSPCVRLARRCPPEVSRFDTIRKTDTVWVERWYRDTVERGPLPQEVSNAAAATSDTAWAQTSYAEAAAWNADGRLNLSLRNKDSADIFARYYHEHIHERHTEERSATTTEVHREDSRGRRWNGFACGVAAALAAIGLCRGAVRLLLRR